METADRALAYIHNQVTLNTVHNLYRFSLPPAVLLGGHHHSCDLF
jgi:hypothetical protein